MCAASGTRWYMKMQMTFHWASAGVGWQLTQQQQVLAMMLVLMMTAAMQLLSPRVLAAKRLLRQQVWQLMARTLLLQLNNRLQGPVAVSRQRAVAVLGQRLRQLDHPVPGPAAAQKQRQHSQRQLAHQSLLHHASGDHGSCATCRLT